MKVAKVQNSVHPSFLIERVFGLNADNLQRVRDHARDFARLIEKVDPFIQKSTEKVCPQCRQVCCINRHSYHSHFDVLYLSALGEKIPVHRDGIADWEPCQFLSPQGCRLRRFLRPYRCTWYFCTPLLEYIRSAPVREYRAFVSCLEQISMGRELVLTAFMEIAKAHFLDADIPPHEFY